ncbi:WGR domain-containing protein [Phormidium sp. LEGE 05292]|uniref:WGR domain-containing protein n=1 Tax=[Phormidium] sp. LEGE 05292 TaxID=767427 RepID=UPI00187EE5C8|nr:WGR domain-containing protein [Phormidium sp. LEGE 05292]MBE9229074.1 WGR domain-containing protein [Phormidium sp. LEGE 05292]
MSNNSSPPFTTEPENNLKEKLIRSIWLHKDKYCYLFESNGSYRLLSTERRGQYTILPDGRSVLLAWITDSFTETLLVQEDGSLFMSGGAFVKIGTRSEASLCANPSIEPNTVYLELSDDHSHKFYEVTVNAFDVIIRYGRIGTIGQTNRSTYSNLQKAQAEAHKKINEKLKKGYVRVRPSSSSLSASITEERSQPILRVSREGIAHQTTPVMPTTLQANQEVWWQAIQLGFGVTVKIVAISQSPSFSLNLMAGQDFAYHFNPRLSEGQIVQNTHIGHWGVEERLSLPQEMGLGHDFTLTITVQETELVVDLNGIFLCKYRHRIPPEKIDGLRLICVQGSLQILSLQISELKVNNTCPQIENESDS